MREGTNRRNLATRKEKKAKRNLSRRNLYYYYIILHRCMLDAWSIINLLMYAERRMIEDKNM